MSDLQIEYMKNPVAAEGYYHAVLSAGTDNFIVFKNYTQFLFDQGRLEEAERANEYAAKLQGVDLSHVIRMRGLIAEKRFAYKKAKRLLESAFCHAYNEDYFSLLRTDIRRVKRKMLFYKNQKKRIKNEK
jgi:Tfp pilus assembly protein PilF